MIMGIGISMNYGIVVGMGEIWGWWGLGYSREVMRVVK
jgi:hypothetical protein